MCDQTQAWEVQHTATSFVCRKQKKPTCKWQKITVWHCKVCFCWSPTLGSCTQRLLSLCPVFSQLLQNPTLSIFERFLLWTLNKCIPLSSSKDRQTTEPKHASKSSEHATDHKNPIAQTNVWDQCDITNGIALCLMWTITGVVKAMFILVESHGFMPQA